ncbi:nitrile hydratase accessory protein [Streptomyces tremellae]|uniref:Nitrile hydratase beta subunit-like N-terminal domain-containing protein n=1 Tax=Streptomyces tremellae TaxID=1124239 RepID=A0ABP7FTH5_9ACTN
MSAPASFSESEVRDLHDCSAALPQQRPDENPFRIPWELRAFALGVAGHEGGHYPWSDFQSALIENTAHADAAGRAEQYYARWIEAFEQVILDRAGVSRAELDDRTATILATPRDATHQHAHPEPIAVADAHHHH